MEYNQKLYLIIKLKFTLYFNFLECIGYDLNDIKEKSDTCY